MINKSKLALVIALVAGIASPALASQANHAQRHLYDYAPVASASAPQSNPEFAPATTGGGSTGYNAMVQIR